MEETNIPTEQINQPDENQGWLLKEQEELEQNKTDNLAPALKLEDGKITSFIVDFSKPFDKWTDPQTNTIKKIIPVTHEGEEKVLWLNVRNPLYRQLVEAGTTGQRQFKVMRTGVANQTRYSLVKE